MSNISEIFTSRKLIILVAMAISTIIPLSLMFWLGNVLVAIVKADDTDSVEDVISPSRWFNSLLIPLVMCAYGMAKKSISISGMILGFFVGFILTISSYLFLACLMTFFISSSKATKFRSDVKKKIEYNFQEGGRRNWIQVLCNGGMPTILALFYVLDSGYGERPIDFIRDYHASWLSVGIVGSFAAACGDTWASELGTVMRFSSPVLVTNLKKVPKGTNGGVSVPGLWFSFAGGLLIGLSYYVALIYIVDSSELERSPPQWPIILIGGVVGFVGSLIDSILGATLQYSGMDKDTGLIVDQPGPNVVHISGRNILDNHGVNLICNVVVGILTPKLANMVWP